MNQALQRELKPILVFIGVIWGVFLVDVVLPIDFNAFGLTPRTLSGLIGIPAMPFLHGGFGHLVGNTIPLFVLLVLLAGSRTKSWETVAGVVALTGVLLWLFGRPSTHVGASGLVFGLISFLIVTGFLEKRPISLVVSFIVGFLYGGTLLWGVLPKFGSTESWDGHLCGAIAGGIVSYALTRRQAAKPA